MFKDKIFLIDFFSDGWSCKGKAVEGLLEFIAW